VKLNFKALVISWVLTVVVVTIGMLGIGVLLGKKRVRDYQRGWNLVKVVVAARDLPIGTKLGATDLAIREVPEQLTQSAILEADLLLPHGHALTLPLKKNDVLASWMYTHRPPGASCQRFAEDLAKNAKVSDAPEVKKLLAELSQQIDGGTLGE
jgi:hypothetical protein